MSYRTQVHSDWRGREGTAFHIRHKDGSTIYLYVPDDRSGARYESQGAAFNCSRRTAYATIVNARNCSGTEISAVRYRYRAQ